jgi:hypothetical protein
MCAHKKIAGPRKVRRLRRHNDVTRRDPAASQRDAETTERELEQQGRRNIIPHIAPHEQYRAGTFRNALSPLS